jgi:hypothetical protein
MMQRHLHHIPDEHVASQAAGTSSLDDMGYPISPDLVWNTLRIRCEGLFRPWPTLLRNVPSTSSLSLISLTDKRLVFQ